MIFRKEDQSTRDLLKRVCSFLDSKDIDSLHRYAILWAKIRFEELEQTRKTKLAIISSVSTQFNTREQISKNSD